MRSNWDRYKKFLSDGPKTTCDLSYLLYPATDKLFDMQNRDAVWQTLKRMRAAGEVVKVGYGTYALPQHKNTSTPTFEGFKRALISSSSRGMTYSDMQTKCGITLRTARRYVEKSKRLGLIRRNTFAARVGEDQSGYYARYYWINWRKAMTAA